MLTLRLPQDFHLGDSAHFDDIEGEPTTVKWAEEDVLLLNDTEPRYIHEIVPDGDALVFSVDDPEDDLDDDDEEA